MVVLQLRAGFFVPRSLVFAHKLSQTVLAMRKLVKISLFCEISSIEVFHSFQYRFQVLFHFHASDLCYVNALLLLVSHTVNTPQF